MSGYSDFTRSDFYHRIVAAERVGHIGVGGPVVLPALTIQQVAEAVLPARLEGDSQREAPVLAALHGVGSRVPLVELTAQIGGLSVDLRRELRSPGTSGRL